MTSASRLDGVGEVPQSLVELPGAAWHVRSRKKYASRSTRHLSRGGRWTWLQMIPYCHTTSTPLAGSWGAVQIRLFRQCFLPESSPKLRCVQCHYHFCASQDPCLGWYSRDLGPTRVAAVILWQRGIVLLVFLGPSVGRGRNFVLVGCSVLTPGSRDRFAKKGLNFVCGPRQVWPRSIM